MKNSLVVFLAVFSLFAMFLLAIASLKVYNTATGSSSYSDTQVPASYLGTGYEAIISAPSGTDYELWEPSRAALVNTVRYLAKGYTLIGIVPSDNP